MLIQVPGLPKPSKKLNILGQMDVIASSKDSNYTHIPKGYAIDCSDYEFLHTTSNNTIFGTQYQEWPDSPIPMVCDMSSDIFSRPIDYKRFGLIYAGAQKILDQPV